MFNKHKKTKNKVIYIAKLKLKVMLKSLQFLSKLLEQKKLGKIKRKK